MKLIYYILIISMLISGAAALSQKPSWVDLNTSQTFPTNLAMGSNDITGAGSITADEIYSGGELQRNQTQSYSFMLSKIGSNYCETAANGTIIYSHPYPPYVIQKAINDTAAISGKLVVGPAQYWMGYAQIILPWSASGYTVKGEYSAVNSVMGGAVFLSEGAGYDLFKLDSSQHSNNIIFEDINFYSDTGTTGLLNLTQPSSAASRFIVRRCHFYGTANMAGNSSLLTMYGTEDSIIDNCFFTPGIGRWGLNVHVPGGFFTIRDSGLAKSNISGLQINFEGNVQGGNINIDVPASGGASPNINLIGHWIESSGLTGTAINNTSGVPVYVSVLGGRWNQEYSRAFLGGTSPIYATVDSVILNSNDASACELVDNLVSHQIITRNLKFINGALNTYGLTESSGARRIGTGSEETIAHGLAITPTNQSIILTPESATALPYISKAADATNFYVVAGSGQPYSWRIV